MKRIRSQITREDPQVLFWKIVSADEANKIINRLKHTQSHYKRLPLSEDEVAIIADNNRRLKGEPLPTDSQELNTLIERLANTPRGMHQSSSYGFGGMYANCKSRRKSNAKSTVNIVDAKVSNVRGYAEKSGAQVEIARTPGAFAFRSSPEQNKAMLAAMEDAGIDIGNRDEVPMVVMDAMDWSFSENDTLHTYST